MTATLVQAFWQLSWHFGSYHGKIIGDESLLSNNDQLVKSSLFFIIIIIISDFSPLEFQNFGYILICAYVFALCKM